MRCEIFSQLVVWWVANSGHQYHRCSAVVIVVVKEALTFELNSDIQRYATLKQYRLK